MGHSKTYLELPGIEHGTFSMKALSYDAFSNASAMSGMGAEGEAVTPFQGSS